MEKLKNNYQIIRTIVKDDGWGGKDEHTDISGYIHAYSRMQALNMWCRKAKVHPFSSYGTGCGGSVRTFYEARAV